MEIRIDIESEGPEVILHVAGRLTGPAIKQLEDVCEPMKAHCVLDLSKLMFTQHSNALCARIVSEHQF